MPKITHALGPTVAVPGPDPEVDEPVVLVPAPPAESPLGWAPHRTPDVQPAVPFEPDGAVPDLDAEPGPRTGEAERDGVAPAEHDRADETEVASSLPGTSSSTSSGTSGSTPSSTHPDPHQPARTTESRSGKARTGSSTAHGTAGDPGKGDDGPDGAAKRR